jgi:hypothetical protein
MGISALEGTGAASASGISSWFMIVLLEGMTVQMNYTRNKAGPNRQK